MSTTRDQIRLHFYSSSGVFKRRRDGVRFKMVAHSTAHNYIEFRKIKPDGTLGRLRLLDIVSFSKSFAVVL